MPPTRAPRRGPAGRRRDERGVALPSTVVLLSVVAVAMAALALLTTQPGPPGTLAQTSSRTSSPSSSPGAPTPTTGSTPGTSGAATQTPRDRPRKLKPLVRSEVFVEVYNNTGIKDLAASTAIDAAGAGWNMVGTDNWLGTIPATAVYYPPRLERAAKALARDLGIARTAEAVEPMKFDRLTVILTLDFV